MKRFTSPHAPASRWLQLLVATGFVSLVTLLMAGAVISYRALTFSHRSHQTIERTYREILSLDKVLLDLVNAETAKRGYSLTQNEDFLELYNAGLRDLDRDLAGTRELMLDEPRQREQMARLEPLIRQRLHLLEQGMQAAQHRATEPEVDAAWTLRGREVMEVLRAAIQDVQEEEKKLLESRIASAEEAQARAARMMLISNCVLIILLLAIGSILYHQVSRSVHVADVDRNAATGSQWPGYVIAVVGTGVATLIRWGLEEMVGPGLPAFITFYPPVLFAALSGGIGPGLLAAGLSTLAAGVVFLPPAGLAVHNPADQVSLAIFCGVNISVILVCAALREERARTRAAARRAEDSERRLRATFQQAAVGIIEIDTEDRLRAANDLACDILKTTPEALMGRSIHDLTHPEDREASRKINREVHEGLQANIAYEKRYLRGDGTPVWVNVSVATLRDAEGRDLGSIGTFQDITDRRIAQQRLQDEKALSDAIVNSLPGVFVLLNAERRLVGFNDNFLVATGYTKREIGNLTALDFVVPEDQPLVDETIRSIMESGEGSAQFRMLQKSGVFTWYSFTARRFEFGGVLGMVAIGLDITARLKAEAEVKTAQDALRQSEERFRALTELSPQMVWRTDDEGRVDYVNERWCAYTGQTVPEACGAGWMAAVHQDDLPAALGAWHHALRTGSSYEVQYRLRSKEGDYHWFLSRGLPMRNAEGKIERWFGSSTDIQQQKFVEEALRESERRLSQARDELARANEDLERRVRQRTILLKNAVAELEGFSYSLVHDMRAPLRAMQSYAFLLQEQFSELKGEAADFLKRIIASSQRMDQLITDSLNYSRLMHEEMPIGALDLAALLRSIIQSYPNLHGADIRLEMDQLAVKGNSAALTHVFSNLLGNAVKFVKPGTVPQVRVWAEIRPCSGDRPRGPSRLGSEQPQQEGSDGSCALVWVEDNGIGIPAHALEKIFVMFERMHKDEYPGTGIGLALVRKSLERIGGRICVESVVDKGSRFCVELPLAKPDLPSENQRLNRPLPR